MFLSRRDQTTPDQPGTALSGGAGGPGSRLSSKGTASGEIGGHFAYEKRVPLAWGSRGMHVPLIRSTTVSPARMRP